MYNKPIKVVPKHKRFRHYKLLLKYLRSNIVHGGFCKMLICDLMLVDYRNNCTTLISILYPELYKYRTKFDSCFWYNNNKERIDALCKILNTERKHKEARKSAKLDKNSKSN